MCTITSSFSSARRRTRKPTEKILSKYVTSNRDTNEASKPPLKKFRLQSLTHSKQRTITIYDMPMKLMPSVVLSRLDKAAGLKLSEDQLTCFGCEVNHCIV